jgi:hypothetical protein
MMSQRATSSARPSVPARPPGGMRTTAADYKHYGGPAVLEGGCRQYSNCDRVQLFHHFCSSSHVRSEALDPTPRRPRPNFVLPKPTPCARCGDQGLYAFEAVLLEDEQETGPHNRLPLHRCQGLPPHYYCQRSRPTLTLALQARCSSPNARRRYHNSLCHQRHHPRRPQPPLAMHQFGRTFLVVHARRYAVARSSLGILQGTPVESPLQRVNDGPWLAANT